MTQEQFNLIHYTSEVTDFIGAMLDDDVHNFEVHPNGDVSWEDRVDGNVFIPYDHVVATTGITLN